MCEPEQDATCERRPKRRTTLEQLESQRARVAERIATLEADLLKLNAAIAAVRDDPKVAAHYELLDEVI